MRVFSLVAVLALTGCAAAPPVCPNPRAGCPDRGDRQATEQSRPQPPEPPTIDPEPGKRPNAGRGNGPEGNPDQDPGRSGGHNNGGD